ncbi:MAG: hypothetical protein DRN49_03540 [Thaumarchaeota archaeon]|nr:MAG: hypothetical protein DRN49_03540 [Nitrososphaerota archaeon]
MIGVEVLGVNEVVKNLKHMNKKTLKNVNNAIHKAGLFLQGEVKLSIAGWKKEPRSVDTGRFLDSVETDNSKFLESIVLSKVHYAKYLEYGTSKIKPPRRHFRNSKARNEKKILGFVKEAVKKVII